MTLNTLFDAAYYRQVNSDLATLSDEQLVNHFVTYGVFEGRQFSRFADLNFYRASNSDLAGLDNLSLFVHLRDSGVAEGRRFSPYYDTLFYKGTNVDLATLDNESLFNHFQGFGLQEGRYSSAFFDIQYYRQNNTDLSSLDNTTLLEHLKTSGLAEGRKTSRFVDVSFYLSYISSYQDLAATATQVNNNAFLGFQKLQTDGLPQGQRFSAIVDLDFYRDYNPDLASLDNISLFTHLVLNGSQEGRRLSVSYDPSFYLNANPDLAGFGTNYLQLLNHFQTSGIAEGRQSSDSFSPSFYLNNNTDLAGLNNQQALNHYEVIGLHEGRQANNLALSAATAGTFVGNATNLGAFTVGRSGAIAERVDNNSQGDVYKFTVATPSNVSLQITNLSAQVNYLLFNDGNANGQYDTGEFLRSIATSSNSDIGGNLAAGTYYLIVQQAAKNQQTNYRLNLSVSQLSISNPDQRINTSRDPGESAVTALNLGVLSLTNTTIELNDFIGTSDSADIYRFTVTTDESFDGQVFNISSPITAEVIIDSNGNGILGETGETIFTKTSDSNNNNIFLLNLVDEYSGTFYIRITPTPATTSGTYSLGYDF